MLTQQEIQKFKDDYLALYGITIDNLYDDPNLANADINDADRTIELFVTENCPKYRFWKTANKLDKLKKEALWEAKLIQFHWVKEVGNFKDNAGYDNVNMNYADDREIQKRVVSKEAIKVLSAHGLLYAGLGITIPNDVIPWL